MNKGEVKTMSYCRFSSDDFQSDIYCYESVNGGYAIYVASKRHVIENLPPPIENMDWNDPVKTKEWCQRHSDILKLVETAKLVKIGLRHDGEFFNESSPTRAAQRLVELQNIGYNVPDYAIEALLEEAEEEKEIVKKTRDRWARGKG
jgi:hypothetical protein